MIVHELFNKMLGLVNIELQVERKRFKLFFKKLYVIFMQFEKNRVLQLAL